MTSVETVAKKVAEITTLTAQLVPDAASNLYACAESKKLTLKEIDRHLDSILKVLRGSEVKSSPYEVAQDMLKSCTFNKETGSLSFTIPAGVTEVGAMEALNMHFRKNHPQFGRDAIYAGDLNWYRDLPSVHPSLCKKRDASEERVITITAVVENTTGKRSERHAKELTDKGLQLSDPRDQAIAAALYACQHNGKDLFKNLWVRGCIPGFALNTDRHDGVGVCGYNDETDYRLVGASGSLSMASK